MGKGYSHKSEGTWDVRRNITIPSLQHEADSRSVRGVVDTLAGVCQAEVELRRHRLKVRYDVTQVDFQMIKAELETAGYPTATGRWLRIKERWYRFIDTNMRENAHAPPPACCNKPPKRR
jgi:uncharacterized protein YchJ